MPLPPLTYEEEARAELLVIKISTLTWSSPLASDVKMSAEKDAISRVKTRAPAGKRRLSKISLQGSIESVIKTLDISNFLRFKP